MMELWQAQFTNYTTGVAFNLQLSHDQCDLILFLYDELYDEWHWQSRTNKSNWMPTFRSVERRGLVEYNPMAAIRLDPGVKLRWIYRLTLAGKHVAELLKLAGLKQSNPLKPKFGYRENA